jgi:hypothetical protein
MEPPPYPLDTPGIMTDYLQWHHIDVPLEYQNLVPRQRVEEWLYRLFLTLAVPMERECRRFVLIYSPLNMTAFIRLCAHLHTIGYPAHWMGAVLAEIISGSIATKARAPKTDPLGIEETDNQTKNSVLRQSTAPFAAEMSTLLAIFQSAGALPFGIISPNIPPIGLVYRYSVTFSEVSDALGEPPAFVLVLFDASLLPPGSLHPYLLSDGRGDMSEDGREIREKGLHVISTRNWDRANLTAEFWFRRDVFEELLCTSGGASGDEWAVAIWRTDEYVCQSPLAFVGSVEDRGVWAG